MSKAIQWFPGHMAKAIREVESKMKIIDIVIEIRDARAIISSKNYVIDELIKNKPRVIIINKADLSDETITQKWSQYLIKINQRVIITNLLQQNPYKLIVKEINELLKEKLIRDSKKKIKNSQIRTIILGIPNVGKSTLINKLVNKKVANIGNMPGVTRGQQWIKLNETIYLLDTPGILMPKIVNEQQAIHLALIGTIKQEILPLEIIYDYGLNFLKINYPSLLLNEKYLLKSKDDLMIYQRFLNDFKNGKIIKLSLEKPGDKFE